MNLNATLIGQTLAIFFLLAPVFAFICYQLGKKKTTSPKTAAFIGGALSLFPPLNLIFIAALVLKNDVT